jgi:hypothetical protein
MNMIPTLASADVISDLATDLGAYSTAAFTLVAAVLAVRIGLKWIKGLSSKAS